MQPTARSTPCASRPDRQGARAVAQVPDGEGARLVDGGGETGQVVQPARAVVDVVEQDGRRTGAERGPHIARGRPGRSGAAGHPGRRLGDVAVGGEGRGVDQDLVRARSASPPAASRTRPHALKTLTLVESPTTICPAAAPPAGRSGRRSARARSTSRSRPRTGCAARPTAGRRRRAIRAGTWRGQRAQRVAVEVDALSSRTNSSRTRRPVRRRASSASAAAQLGRAQTWRPRRPQLGEHVLRGPLLQPGDPGGAAGAGLRAHRPPGGDQMVVAPAPHQLADIGQRLAQPDELGRSGQPA